MATLWNKGTKASDIVEDFTVGNDRTLDMALAKYDVIGSKAHIRMLESIGLLTRDELETLSAALDVILSEIEEGKFVLEDDVEDIHSQVELLLTRRLGDMGKKIHSGRSRNDQVLVDVKLFLMDELKKVRDGMLELSGMLRSLSEKYRDVMLPDTPTGRWPCLRPSGCGSGRMRNPLLTICTWSGEHTTSSPRILSARPQDTAVPSLSTGR